MGLFGKAEREYEPGCPLIGMPCTKAHCDWWDWEEDKCMIAVLATRVEELLGFYRTGRS